MLSACWCGGELMLKRKWTTGLEETGAGSDIDFRETAAEALLQ